MTKDFKAYYSKYGAWIFLSCALFCLVAIVLLSIFWVNDSALIFIILFSMIAAVSLFCFADTIRKDGVAVEIAENKLVLYKKDPVVIPLTDVWYVSVHNGFGSFDILIKTQTKKYQLHCFIKEGRKKKEELICLLRSKGIKVDTFALGDGS